MNCKKMLAAASAVVLAALVASVAIADTARDALSEMKLPPGWTQDDMKACMLAATPGKMHDYLAKNLGVWRGKNTLWMGADTQPLTSDSTTSNSWLMEGRYLKSEMSGQMPGMGPYSGFALYGFDNVSQKFVCTWVDNMATGLCNGEGTLSADGKVLTWNFTFNCPINKKPVVMRQIETTTGPTTKTIEAFTTDPKTGKEYKMMVIELTKE